MRRRLLSSTLAAVGIALVLLGLPLAVAVETLQEQAAFDVLQAEAEQVRVVLREEASSPQAAAAILDLVARSRQQRFTVLDGNGRVVIDSGPQAAAPGTPVMTPDAEEARRRGGAGFWRGEGNLWVSVPLSLGGTPLVLRVAQPDEDLHRDVRTAWLAIAALGITALAVAALLAVYQGQRLAAPLEALADSARRMGDGDFTASAPRSGLPEADDVAAAMDRTAGRLATTLERSRSFGADASHQLRTPLTALRLDLEALELAGAEPALVSAAMVEADRLEATIDELLALARPAADAEPVDLGELASRRLDAWRAIARAQGRDVVLDAGPVAPVRARAPALGQCLQVLLDNALEHGRGTITVTVRHVPGPGARLCVSDEGPGFAAGDPPRSIDRHGGQRGRGLPLARSLVEAEGGRLFVERPERGARVCLLLPGVAASSASPPSAAEPGSTGEGPGVGHGAAQDGARSPRTGPRADR